MSDQPTPLLLSPPPLDWDAAGVPTATLFGDVYFSREGGVAETEYVFLRHNQLYERWAALDAEAAGTFVVGETGFGTGLNFLCAARLWLATAPASWRLHFLSTERYPLGVDQLAQAARHWPELGELAAELQAVWPVPVRGFHSRDLAGGRIRLQLLLGDGGELLPQLEDSTVLPSGFAVDAWFLDGFAPARNPQLWHDHLLLAIGRLSRPGTTVATFTSAGQVRRGLGAAGFAVQRVPGYGRKREMLAGEQRGLTALPPQSRPTAEAPPNAADYWAWPPPARRRQPVIVIGGGLAGTSTARALAERGFPVTLLEAQPTLAAGASGNPLGVLFTRLSAHDGAVGQFALASWLHALARYEPYLAQEPALGQHCGMLQLYDDEQQLTQLATAFANAAWVRRVTAAEASVLAGTAIEQPALWFPRAGWLDPARLCTTLATHPLIARRLATRVTGLEQTATGWAVHSTTRTFEAAIVVVATARDTAALLPDANLPLRSIRGQITLIGAGEVAQPPRTVVCHDGYAAALPDGTLCCGATFDLRDDDPTPRSDSHAANLAALRQALPALLAGEPDPATLSGRVGFRCASPDYLPVVGPLPDPALTRERFGSLRSSRSKAVRAEPAWLPGLFINVAHGSRGLTSTPLCAELLAALIAGEPRPLPRELVQALNPARFLIRELKRCPH